MRFALLHTSPAAASSNSKKQRQRKYISDTENSGIKRVFEREFPATTPARGREKQGDFVRCLQQGPPADLHIK
jgi:hypothetical protein